MALTTIELLAQVELVSSEEVVVIMNVRGTKKMHREKNAYQDQVAHVRVRFPNKKECSTFVFVEISVSIEYSSILDMK